MHIVIGGAFNGKKEWVKNIYGQFDIQWLEESPQIIKTKLPQEKQSILVLTGIENWTKEWLLHYSMDDARKMGQKWIEELIHWEKESKKRQVILIATDISKGIVPLEKADRDWRDLTGWFYQDLVKQADRVDAIWYGLGQQLK